MNYFQVVQEFRRTPILQSRHRLEKHKLAEGILATVNALLSSQGLILKEGRAVDATLVAASSSTKNWEGERDPEMHSSKKANQWHFGMKVHIGVDTDSGLVHTVRGSAGHVSGATYRNGLLHGEETVVFNDAGNQCSDKRHDVKAGVRWQAAMRPGKRRELDKQKNPINALIEKVEKLKASIWAKVEYSFRGIKCQFGFVKVH